MNKTIIVTKKEFIQYIHSKPKDTPVDMGENLKYDCCGCVMNQYDKDRGVEFNCCHDNYWSHHSMCHPAMKFERGVGLDDFIDWSKEMNTFGDLQLLNPLPETTQPL